MVDNENLLNNIEVDDKIYDTILLEGIPSFNLINHIGVDSPVKCSVDQIFDCAEDFPQQKNIQAHFKLQNDPRPHLKIRVFDMEVVGLMDSGATCTLLGEGSETVLAKFKLLPRTSRELVRVADGDYQESCGIVDIPYTFNGITRVIPTLIVPRICTFLTLGMDFWNVFGFTPALINSMELSSDITSFIFINEEEQRRLGEVVKTFLITTEDFFGCTQVLKHKIDTGSASPVRRNPRPVPYHLMSNIDKELNRLTNTRKVIRECPESPWLNPIQPVLKKSGEVRLCLDARWLNQVTVRDSYALPHIEGIIGRLEEFKFLSSIDLSDAFLQIPLDESSQLKTAFAIPGRKMYCYTRMPFGLMNSPMTMARLMNMVIGTDLEPQVFCFLDDIIIATNDFDSHIEMLSQVSNRLRNANLSINLDKSKFCAERLEYLGYVLSPKGIGTNEYKIGAILHFPVPMSVTQLRQFLGMVGWFRRFIPHFASIAKPLTDLLKGSPRRIVWNDKAEQSFTELKNLLTSAPILKLPDYSQPFTVRSDASDVGAGGILLQGSGDDERIICYISKKFTLAEQNYTTTEKEAYAALICLRRFAPFLLYKKFRLESDHSALLWILRQKEAKGRIGRWIIEFQQYEFDLVHRPGREMVVPDALSRNVSSVMVEQDEWYNKLFADVSQNAAKFPEYKVDGNNLFKYCKVKTPFKTTSFKWKLCVPKSDRKDLLNRYHDHPTSSHFGFFKTYRKISSRYFWPTMRTDVRNYIRNCEVCKSTKSPNVPLSPPMGSHVSVSRPWEYISLDFVGPLTKSSEGYRQLLVIVDKCTKFVLLYPLRNSTTNSLVKVLSQHVFPIFGVPKIIFSDNGPAFISNSFKEFIQGLNVTHWATPAYSPQSNPTERTNRTIITAIRAYISKKHNDWPKYLPEIGMAIRSSVHDGTQYTPYFLNFGQEMIVDGNEYAVVGANKQLSLEERLDALELGRGDAKLRLKKAHEDSKRIYDLRARPKKFSVGEIVYRRPFVLSDATKGVQAKFCPWVKSKVIAVNGQAYELEDIESRRKGVYHGKDIKPG